MRRVLGHSLVVACLDTIATMAGSVRPVLRIDGATVTEHPLLTLLWHPSPTTDYAGLVRHYVYDWLLVGRVCAERVRSGAGRLVELRPLPAHRVVEDYDPSGMLRGVVYTRPGDMARVRLRRDMVLWSIDPSPGDPWQPTERARILDPLVRLDDALTQYVADILDQGLVRGALVTRDQTTDQQRRDLQARWDAVFRRRDDRGSIATPVLDGTRAEWVRVGLDPSDIDIADLCAHTETRICAILGVPPIVVSAAIGLKRATYANYREARRRLWDETVLPLLSRFGQLIESQLAPDFGLAPESVEIVWDADAMPGLDESRDSLWERAVSGWKSQLLTRNEARAMLGYPRDSQGDVYLAAVTDMVEPAQLEEEPA